MHQIMYPHGYVFWSVVVGYLGVFFVRVYSTKSLNSIIDSSLAPCPHSYYLAISHSSPRHSTVNVTGLTTMPSEPRHSVDAMLPRRDALRDAIHDAAPPAGCDAPRDVIRAAASVQAECEALRKSIREAEECLRNLEVYSDLHAADNAMQRLHAYDAITPQPAREALTAHEAPMPQPLATPHARRISRYTQAQVTPALQPLVSEIDLTRLMWKLPQRTHHHTREIINVLPDLAIDPKPPDIPPASALGSFSLVGLTGAAPTPDLTDLVPSPESPAPVDHHYVSLVETRLPSITAIADEIKMRRSGAADVLGALRITFEPSLSNEFFPEKFEEVPPVEGVHRVPRHRLHPQRGWSAISCLFFAWIMVDS